jgi:chromosome segregation ATPase
MTSSETSSEVEQRMQRNAAIWQGMGIAIPEFVDDQETLASDQETPAPDAPDARDNVEKVQLASSSHRVLSFEFEIRMWMQEIEEAFEKLQKEVATIKDDTAVTKAVDREEMHVLVKKENEELRMQLNGEKEDNRGLNNTVMKLQEEIETIKADLAVVEAVVNIHADPRSGGGCLESTPVI